MSSLRLAIFTFVSRLSFKYLYPELDEGFRTTGGGGKFFAFSTVFAFLIWNEYNRTLTQYRAYAFKQAAE